MGEVETEATTVRKRKGPSDFENPEVSPEKKAKVFCCRTFRQELRGNDAFKSLKGFISSAKNSDDVVYEYLNNGGSLKEILALIDKTATGDLTTALPVFEAVHLILLRFQSSDSKYHEKCIESARTILRSYIFIIKAMLSMNVAKQKKVALKVLTAIATLDSSFASEIINVVALSPTLITDLIQPSSEKESVRKCFILFILSFLVEGNIMVVKNLMDKKDLLSSIIPGLKFDEAATVNLILSLLEDKILKNTKIHKTLKLKVFNTQVIKSLFDLYKWRGLQGVKQLLPKKKKKVKELEVNQSDKNVVIESVQSFLTLLCCSQKYGIAFYDKSLGTSEKLYNQLLLTVLESLPDPLENKKMAEIVLKILISCTDLIKPVLFKLEPFFQPRNSKNWFHTIEIAESLITQINAGKLLKSDSEFRTVNQIIKVGKALCAPVVFLKVVKLGSQKQQPFEIRLRTLRFLTTIWNEIQKLFREFYNIQNDLRKPMYKHLFKFLPDPEDLLELWHTLCDSENFTTLPFSVEKKVQFLITVVDSLHVTVECQSDSLCSPLRLASDLLRHIDGIKACINEQEFDEVQVKIVQFLKIDLQALIADAELLEKSLLILLRFTDKSSLSFLSKILSNLDVFVESKSEIDVWLSNYVSLPEEYRFLVADYLIQSFRIPENEEIEKNGKTKLVKDETTFQSTDEYLSPVLFNCFKIYKAHSSKKGEKLSALRHFLNEVTVHLQHFYSVDVYLHDLTEDVNKAVSKATLNYLKNWKNSCLKPVVVNAFSYRSELDLVCWLLNEEKEPRTIGEIIDLENSDLLKLYSLFRIVVAYLTKKTECEDMTESDTKKFVEVLSVLCHTFESDGESIDLISRDVENKSVYQRNCLNCLFANKHLLKAFDPFRKKLNSSFYVTQVLFKVLMEKDIIKSSSAKKKLSEAWKCKFLKHLKAKLKKNKGLDGVTNLEKILNFFEYDHADVKELIELFVRVSDLDLFVKGNMLSDWVVILSKFIKLHCQQEELSLVIIEKLCAIMKHLNERCSAALDEMTNCFVYLIRKHPSHLLLIDNEFLNAILPSTKINDTLKKLLLNDPNKVNCFLNYIVENLNTLEEPHVVFFLLPSLIVSEDSFLDIFKGARSVWKMSEITSATPGIFNALEVVFKKFEKNILQTLRGEKDETVLMNLPFARELIRLFLEAEKILKMKKEISRGKFEPELLFEVIKKHNESDLIKCYVQGLLKMFCRIIKKSSDVKIDWTKYFSIVFDVIELNKESSWQTIVDSTEWKKFTKLAIGHCLSSIQHFSLMKILRLLISAFYTSSEESKDCCLFFQMVISHSQFLKVILSTSPLKAELVELYRCLIERSPSEMSPKHFPILLASYNASMSPSDRTLLKVLSFYEKKKIAIGNYEPFVWGNTAISHYSIGTNPGLSLWQHFNMGNILDLLDTQKLELSLKEFPIRRSLEAIQSTDYDSSVYDPAFLLPLFANLLSPGSVVFCLPFIYKGGLAYTVRALSSECEDIRSIAAIVLTRYYNHLELSQNLKQKLVWMHFINCFRYGIEDLSAKPLPNITTLFFSRMTLELSRQPAEMYSPLQNFLLAKPFFVFNRVPEFFPLFHSSEVSYWDHRKWLLEVIRDGAKTGSDVEIIFHSMGLKVIFCLFHSQLCDTETKKLILQVIEKMLKIDKSIFLISGYGVLDWLTSIDHHFFHLILHDLLNLLYTVTKVIIKDIIHKGQHLNASHLIQILNIAVKLSPSLKEVDDFTVYLNIINEICSLFVKQGKNDWFKINKTKLSDILEAGVAALGDDNDCRKFTKVPFYFRDVEEKDGCEELKKLVFLFNILANEE